MTTTEDAIAAIGEGKGDDYKLEPQKHAQSLPRSAGALRRVLEQPEFVTKIAGYGTFDRQAVEAQDQYKRICRRTLIVLALASVVGVAAAVMPLAQPYDGYVRWGAILLVYGAMIIALLSLRTLDRADPYKRWHQNRAHAEIMRGELFRTVMNAAASGQPGAGEIDLLPLKLEYVRRYHVDTQRNYYSQRADQHLKALRTADRWRKFGTGFLVVWVICALAVAITPVAEPMPVLTPLQGFFGLFEWMETSYLDVILLSVGLFAMVGYGVALAMSSVSNDLRNAGRFRAYHIRVLSFYERLPTVRSLARDPANADKVSAFVAEIQNLFDTEHRDWKLMQEFEAAQPEPSTPAWWKKLNPFGPRATP